MKHTKKIELSDPKLRKDKHTHVHTQVILPLELSDKEF